jgi:UDP-N-acetylmuramoylalanine--D-glutamate ligase
LREYANAIEQATQTAFATAHDAQADQATILLSPAAASFDQFNSFEQRGDAFRDAVNHILFHTSTKEHAHV